MIKKDRQTVKETEITECLLCNNLKKSIYINLTAVITFTSHSLSVFNGLFINLKSFIYSLNSKVRFYFLKHSNNKLIIKLNVFQIYFLIN
jgi:hypothetical protein